MFNFAEIRNAIVGQTFRDWTSSYALRKLSSPFISFSKMQAVHYVNGPDPDLNSNTSDLR